MARLIELTEHIHIRMDPETRKKLEKQASERGLSVSAYIRFLVFRVDREDG